MSLFCLYTIFGANFFTLKITDLIKQEGNTFFSFEILPPLRGKSIDALYEGIDPLMEFNPRFINVTYHREEYVTREYPDGHVEKVSTRKRPGTVAVCAAIKHKYKVEAVPHLICGGFTKEETEYALMDCHYLGINNVLALRGDPVKGEAGFTPTPGGNRSSLELITQIQNLNKGKYLHEEMEAPAPTDFCVGVSGYPEKHFEAADMQSDIAFLKQKVDAGADFVVTQLFYDNQKYFEYVDACRAMGINIPIIPGLKPITTLKQIELLPKVFYINFPTELKEQLDRCKTDTDVKEVGIDWGIKQAKELLAYGIPSLHYYTMGKSQAVSRILRSVF